MDYTNLDDVREMAIRRAEMIDKLHAELGIPDNEPLTGTGLVRLWNALGITHSGVCVGDEEPALLEVERLLAEARRG